MRNGFLAKSQKAAGLLAIAMICAWLPGDAAAQIVVVPPPELEALNQSSVPEPPQLARFVKNKPAAIRLGKAFFWDMQVGSDGTQACGTCHFNHGVDGRLKNTLNPGSNAGDTAFGNNSLGVPGFPRFGPNYTLDPVNDFPFHQRQAPADSRLSPIVRHTNDVVGSQGIRLSDFMGVVPGSAVDSIVSAEIDPVFNAGGVNMRRVTGRQAPNVINAIFNFTNFWDGRANFLFNGENPFGPADPGAGVWFEEGGTLVKRPVFIQFASLASQATGPPMDTTEMAGRGRTFPDLGRKMLSLTPLGKQFVHPGDSVLGPMSRAVVQPDGTIRDIKGLNTTYSQMIQEAFRNDLWNSSQLTPDGFIQMEANFSLFWGLAIQLYEATLVSDQTPFDQWLSQDTTALTEQQKLGFLLFNGMGNCVACHAGIELSSASVNHISFLNNFVHAAIELMFVADGRQVIYDEGFNNTSVTPTMDDIGRGASAPFTNPLTGRPFPLSFSSLSILQKQGLLPFETLIMDSFIPTSIPVNVNGLFKVPQLRNVELTAPYFHNGSIMTLEEVVDVYVRGGNFPAENIADLDPIIGAGLALFEGRDDLHDALVAFLKSLTDERVRNESAPFDHPEIFIPEGDPEILRRIPARDASGSAAALAAVRIGGAPGTAFENAAAGDTLTLTINVTNSAGALPANISMEWLPVGVRIGPYGPLQIYLFSGTALIALADATPATSIFRFDHAADTVSLFTLSPASLGLRTGDAFFYGYAYSPTAVSAFTDRGLVIENVVWVTVQ